jgi:hypothetical protein
MKTVTITKLRTRNMGKLVKFKASVDMTEGELLCPVCGFDHTKVTGDPFPITGSSEVDGDILAIPMECEEGHEFLVNFGFHKGRTIVWGEELT